MYYKIVWVKIMSKVRKVYEKVSDVIEVYFPSVTFVALFLSYVIMILYRYIFNAGVNKVYELSMILFVWTVILSASYSSRVDNHIMFTMFYDKLSPKTQHIFHLIGDAAIVAALIMILPHTIEAVSFLKIKKSSMLKIPFNIIYAPIIVYNVMTILHHCIQAVNAVKAIAECGKEKE